MTTRRGITLIELLVVIVITLAITLIAIPLFAPSNKDRTMRETSRILTTALAQARANAIKTGRPYGVLLQRFPGLPEMCVTITFAESRQPYSGDTDTSGVVVGWLPGPDDGWGVQGTDDNLNGIVDEPAEAGWLGSDDVLAFPGSITFVGGDVGADAGWLNHVIKRGDSVRINHQGPLYMLDSSEPFYDTNGNGVRDSGEWTDVNGNSNYDLMTDEDGHVNTPLNPNGTLEVPWQLVRQNPAAMPLPPAGFFPFQILRLPDPASGPPLQLPESAPIDLTFSGGGGFEPSMRFGASVTADHFQPLAPDDQTPVIIMFAPDGSLEYLHHSDTAYGSDYIRCERPLAAVHLLLGRREFMPANPDPRPGEPVYNYEDLSNQWVTIHAQTGLVTTTELAAYDSSLAIPPLLQSRLYALEGQSKGGR